MRIICWILGCKIGRVSVNNPIIICSCKRCLAPKMRNIFKYPELKDRYYEGNVIKRWWRRIRMQTLYKFLVWLSGFVIGFGVGAIITVVILN